MDEELRSLLGRIRRRWFAAALLTTGGRAAAMGAVPLFAAAVAWRLLAPSGAALIGLGVTAVLLAGAAVVLVIGRVQLRPGDCAVARFVEEQTGGGDAAPALCDSLVSAVQLIQAPAGQQSAFAPLIVANAVRALRAIEPAAVVSPHAMRRATLAAAAGIAVLAVALAASSALLLRAGAATWVAMFPASIQIEVATGDARVAAGQPLHIAATVRGRAATLLGLVPTLVVSADGQQRSVLMQRLQDRFEYGFESVDRSFDYRIAVGSASSPSFSVTALFPPRVTRIDLRYDYPAFTGLRPREEEDGGDIYGPLGTRVRLAIHTDKPVRSGQIALTGAGTVALSSSRSGPAIADLVLTKDDAYRVALKDADGLESNGELEYFIRIMEDRPPDVRIVRPSADQGITPLEEVAIEARAEDDYGVAAFDLVYAVAGRPSRTVPFTRVVGSESAKTGQHLLAAEDLRVQPGDVITYYARARDVARGKRSSETRSDIFFLEVKPFNEEFVAAQSQSMGATAGTPIDSLIAAQKEIINATWNLERRSTAGRSAADLKAVSEAQAELKQRVERLVGGRRGGRGFFPPQQIAAPPAPQRRGSGDPVAAAVEAMGRAVEQLQNERTADAIPHEMSALQGLLQAQAEVRRRQVMQQSNSAAGQGGTSRTDRDLSALFDRELQRQQRTNYETPKPAAESTDRENAGDALERIRDLARRQEELARRQRELADAQMAAAEKQRQLERLTREQEELRRQAEELQKQMGGGNGTPHGASRTQAGEMRRAAEQMRNAAGEMQRRNAAGAAANGERAAEALRQMERQMRGGDAGARQRAAGELQLEAQQVAEAQRRIASEMSRIEKNGQQANADVLRRLATEKDRLADRVDQLQNAAGELERSMPGAAAAPFREAARQLQGERIGERMRGGAKDLRDRAAAGSAAKPGEQAGVEQQLTRALDGVVDRLGGGSQAEARRTTEDLDRAREMRERLDRLERQVRDAEKNARVAAQAGQQAGNPGSTPQQLQRARDEYARELQRTRETLGQLQSRPQQDGSGGSTPEEHEFSRSAPGNESFKQDFSNWEKLRRDVDVRLERLESAAAARLARKIAEDRLSGGGSERVPDAYRESVARYFESLARVKK